MYLFVGLGNPGLQYEDTRHNLGFNFIDAIAIKNNFPSFRQKGTLLLSISKIKNKQIAICKPINYMNKSGVSIAPFVKFYKIDTENIWVIHDDIDLKFMQIKVKRGGSNGGHRGLADIDKYLGREYGRIRVGVGRPFGNMSATDYVLGKFSEEENQRIYCTFDKLSGAILDLVFEPIEDWVKNHLI